MSAVASGESSVALGFAAHNHQRCIRGTLAYAEHICDRDGLQFTPARRRTLELLLQSHVALGAYEVLAGLAGAGLGDKPPIAYRALAFLVEHGFAHRVERLNAFVACTHPGNCHTPAFLICRGCGAIAEAESPPRGAWLQSASASGFQVECLVQEVEGLCPACLAEGSCETGHA